MLQIMPVKHITHIMRIMQIIQIMEHAADYTSNAYYEHHVTYAYFATLCTSHVQ